MRETYAASNAKAKLGWVRCLLLSMAYSGFDLASRTLTSSVARSLVPSVITSEDPSVMDPRDGAHQRQQGP
eukprot:4509788-Alexandrium_andersonii.AAC.1